MIDDENERLLEKIKYTKDEMNHWAYSSETENDYIKRKTLSDKIKERKSFWKVFVWINIILACVCFSGVVSAKECSEWKSLSDNQRKIAEWLYDRGEPHNLQLTLPAISWVESTLGQFRLNVRSGDLGIMQINYKTAENILGVTNYLKKAELHQRLIYDDELNVTLSLDVLEHFKKVHKNDWKKVIMSYNIGNQKDDKNLKKGVAYYKKVSYYLNILQRCSNFN